MTEGGNSSESLFGPHYPTSNADYELVDEVGYDEVNTTYTEASRRRKRVDRAITLLLAFFMGACILAGLCGLGHIFYLNVRRYLELKYPPKVKDC